jgi:hypothetical protein
VVAELPHPVKELCRTVKTKKADVLKHLWVFLHVGLLIIEPPGS